jgi:hypothetical protein
MTEQLQKEALKKFFRLKTTPGQDRARPIPAHHLHLITIHPVALLTKGGDRLDHHSLF